MAVSLDVREERSAERSEEAATAGSKESWVNCSERVEREARTWSWSSWRRKARDGSGWREREVKGWVEDT